MYLQRLIEFTENHDDLIPPLGYKRKKYQWIVDIVDNKLYFLEAVRDMNERTVPHLTRSSGTAPILLVDRADYVFGYSQKQDTKRAKERHQAYMELLQDCQRATTNEDISLLITLLKQSEISLPSTMKETDNIVFRIEGKFLHENKSIQKYWKQKLHRQIQKGRQMQCLVCGEMNSVVERHSINFPLQGQQTKLISANEPAYESHHLKASTGAPTCYNCEQKYGQALEFLLRRHTNPKEYGGPHMINVGDVSYVYWLRTKKQINQLNGIINPSTRNPDEIKELIQSAFAGLQKEVNLNQFCILTLSTNKARLVVRGYEENDIQEVKINIERFFEAQNLDQQKLYGIYTLAKTMKKTSSETPDKYAVQEWVHWFLHGRPLSHRVLLPLLKSIHAGNGIQTHQAAALKSWLVSQNKEVWTMTVNNENNRPPYLCGRLFAVLEVMQSTATNATETIASRYFGSASTTPKAIFGLLIKNSQAHLSKIKKNKEKAYLEKFYIERIQNITMNLPDFPTVLDLKEQAEFALGYYQERQDIFSKKGVDKNEL